MPSITAEPLTTRALQRHGAALARVNRWGGDPAPIKADLVRDRILLAIIRASQDGPLLAADRAAVDAALNSITK